MSCCGECGCAIELDKNEFRLPPWCPGCGANLKLGEKKPALRAPSPSAVAVEEPPPEGYVSRPTAPRRPKLSNDEPPMHDDFARTIAENDLRADQEGLRRHAHGAACVAFGFLAVALWLAYASVEKLWTWKRADGLVLEERVTVSRKGRSSTTYSFTYQVGGKAYKAGRWWDMTLESYQVGNRVVVLYSPTDPSEGMVKSFSNLWAWPIVAFCVSGLVFAIAGSSWTMQRHVQKGIQRENEEAQRSQGA